MKTENIIDMDEYLAQHKAEPIKVGKSGADVYEIDDSIVMKWVRREKLQDGGLFDAYAREAFFLKEDAAGATDRKAGGKRRRYLPEILRVEQSESELFIWMKRYERIRRGALDGELIRKIMGALAMVHTDEIPSFLQQNREKAKALSGREIKECHDGWESVLSEHRGAFDTGWLAKTAERINEIILWHDQEERVLCHGDFHWDNLLIDEEGGIRICDWQNVGAGSAAGDLSFFISRLGADGIQVEEEELLDHYAESIYTLTGRRVERGEILRHRNAANLITSFVFWHHYLHGSSEERVREVYGKMADSLSMLISEDK